jgi:hypothetical protein
MALTVGSAEIAAGGISEPAGQRTNGSIARTAAAPARHAHRKTPKKPDPRPMLIIGIGF